MKNGFSGIFGGIIIFIIGICVLVWNERSNVKNIHDVKELRDVYTDVKSDQVAKDYEDKLIATTGKLDFGEEELKDEVFNISIKTPTLVRVVEMYQWVEETQDDEDKTTYTYKKEWKKELIDSTKFNQSNNHYNPDTMAYDQFSVNAQELKVGAYKLSSAYSSLVTANKTISDLTGAKVPEGYQVYNHYLTSSEKVEEPKIGDIRISFEYADYSDVSVMGKLHDGTLIEYTTKEKSRITVFREGTHDGASLIDEIETGKKAMKWIVRLIGTILIIAGIKSLFGPLTALSSYVPILRNIVGGAVGLISFLVGLAISLIVIAISWVVFRPVLGISLLVAAIVLIILAKKFGSKKGKVAEAAPQPAEEKQE